MTSPHDQSVPLLDEELAHAIEAYVRDRREALFALASALVRHPSTVGSEDGAQRLVVEQLESSGFEIERIETDAAAAIADETAGYPSLSYEGRASVVGTRHGIGGGASLHLSGHVDVVPVDPLEEWTRDPWGGEIADGKLWGRGSGDMKGGLAAYLVAAAAVSELCRERRGDLVVSSVIEEECGGNGMWSVIRAGHSADATLIGESTGLSLGYAGTGVVWARLGARGTAGHSANSGRSGPFDALCRGVGALRQLESQLNDEIQDEVFASASDWPYRLSIGRIEGGVWTSSTPAELVVHVRFGFGRENSSGEVQSMIREAVASVGEDIEVRFEAFRANAYCHSVEGPLPELMRACQRLVVGSEPEAKVFTATTDARFVAGPCLCYGPSAGNLHGADEWVDLRTLEETAVVVALAAAHWIA